MKSESAIRSRLTRIRDQRTYAEERNLRVSVTALVAAQQVLEWILAPDPVPASTISCELCGDCGMVGGNDKPWDWCSCESGDAQRMMRPELVAESNAGREKLLALSSPTSQAYGVVGSARQGK